MYRLNVKRLTSVYKLFNCMNAWRRPKVVPRANSRWTESVTSNWQNCVSFWKMSTWNLKKLPICWRRSILKLLPISRNNLMPWLRASPGERLRLRVCESEWENRWLKKSKINSTAYLLHRLRLVTFSCYIKNSQTQSAKIERKLMFSLLLVCLCRRLTTQIHMQIIFRSILWNSSQKFIFYFCWVLSKVVGIVFRHSGPNMSAIYENCFSFFFIRTVMVLAQRKFDQSWKEMESKYNIFFLNRHRFVFICESWSR